MVREPAFTSDPRCYCMHRFYLPPDKCEGNRLLLTGRAAHHAVNVLRLRHRERVVVLNGAGGEFMCDVLTADRREVALQVLQKNSHPPLSGQVTLIQALTKGKAMDLIVQKATELGAYRLIPVLSERSVSRIEEDRAQTRVEQWRETAIEAIKQCGSAWLPRIEAPLTPQEILRRAEPFELSLIASLQNDARHPRTFFVSFHDEHKRPPQSVAVWVGPEGDFTPAELSAIRASGVLPITLGPLVLRSETAALYCLSVINCELQAPRF